MNTKPIKLDRKYYQYKKLYNFQSVFLIIIPLNNDCNIISKYIPENETTYFLFSCIDNKQKCTSFFSRMPIEVNIWKRVFLDFTGKSFTIWVTDAVWIWETQRKFSK